MPIDQLHGIRLGEGILARKNRLGMTGITSYMMKK